MSTRFIIEDESHAELRSEHSTFAEAVEELKRLSAIPWDQPPNTAPCMSWKTCGRNYEIIEYETSNEPWRQIRRVPAFEINAKGVTWDPDFQI